MVISQQESRESLQLLCDSWQSSILKRSKHFFSGEMKNLKETLELSNQMSNSFAALSELEIRPEWGLPYSKMENYFDEENLERFSSNLRNQNLKIQIKLEYESQKFNQMFKNSDIYYKIEEKMKMADIIQKNSGEFLLVKPGKKRERNVFQLQPMKEDEFKILQELSQSVRKQNKAPKE